MLFLIAVFVHACLALSLPDHTDRVNNLSPILLEEIETAEEQAFLRELDEHIEQDRALIFNSAAPHWVTYKAANPGHLTAVSTVVPNTLQMVEKYWQEFLDVPYHRYPASGPAANFQTVWLAQYAGGDHDYRNWLSLQPLNREEKPVLYCPHNPAIIMGNNCQGFDRRVSPDGHISGITSNTETLAFVIGQDNVMYATSKAAKIDWQGRAGNNKYQIQHATFRGGQPVIAAGIISTGENGQIKKIAQVSGHYQPDTPSMVRLCHWFSGTVVPAMDLNPGGTFCSKVKFYPYYNPGRIGAAHLTQHRLSPFATGQSFCGFCVAQGVPGY